MKLMQELLLIEQSASPKKLALEVQQHLLDHGVDHAPVTHGNWHNVDKGYRISCMIDSLYFDIWVWEDPGILMPITLWSGKRPNPSTENDGDDVFKQSAANTEDLEELISQALSWHQWAPESWP